MSYGEPERVIKNFLISESREKKRILCLNKRKNIYPSLIKELDKDSTMPANVVWKDGQINIGKEFGIDHIKVTNFYLRFCLKL